MSDDSTACDAVILGAGHNALVLHVYLGIAAQSAPEPAPGLLAQLA